MHKGIHLTLLVGPVVPVPVPRAVLDALTEVEVTHNTDVPSAFKLKFNLSNRSPLQTIFLVAAGQTPMLRVIIIVTIDGTPQVLMDGLMTRNQIAPGSQPGQSTLTVFGDDLTKAMKLIDFSGFPFPAMPVEARILLIIAKYAAFGMIPMVIPTLFTDVPIPVERIPAQKGHDLAYVQELARLAGYVFYIDPGPAPGTNIAYWGPEIKVGPPQPALNMDMDAHTNVESLTFSFNTADTTIPIVLIQNQLTKFPIPLPIPNLNPLQPPLGIIPAPVTNVTVLRETAKLPPMEAISRGVAEASRSADAVEGEGSLDVVRYGRILKARQLVGVRGVGMAYNGLYFVKKVTSTLKQGEFKQSFTLTRNGLVSITPRVPV
ncbi:hypothetical protein ABO04_09650 [Nitrosomonas sp. HPC101]|uniref:hypothetical protein n=1 Tax=Nitrosomonas sp. HPC101 TaxID=1658667 RepID=UPI00136DB47C|nr:hypothetical protein [Nitrosomonas sp. HPC101]MXS86156.1 hypothetical protein [Nitrosomonas sp. HPC101]